MKYDIIFRLDRAYMSESYDESRRYGSRWLLVERVIGILFVSIGIILLIYVRGESILPTILIAIGIFELMSNKIKKYFWLKRHSKSKLNNVEVQITLSDSGIESKSPHSSSEIQWNGVERILRTPKGILIWPQKGMHWYLPERVAGTDVIEFINTKNT